MGPRGRRPRRHQRVPDEPRLGSGRALPPGPGPRRHLVHEVRWLPPRRRPVRPGVLRDVATRGRVDRRPAEAPAGGVVGGVGARGHRPRHAEGQPDRCVRRRHVQRLLAAARRRLRGLPDDRRLAFGRVRPCLLHVRLRGARGHSRHGVLIVVGRHALGHAGSPRR